MATHTVRGGNRRSQRHKRGQRPASESVRRTRQERHRQRRQAAARRRAGWAIPVSAVLEFIAWGMAMNFDSLGIDPDSPSFWLPLIPAAGAAVSAIAGVQAAIQAKTGFGLVLLTVVLLIAAILGGLALWFVLEFARNFSF